MCVYMYTMYVRMYVICTYVRTYALLLVKTSRKS